MKIPAVDDHGAGADVIERAHLAAEGEEREGVVRHRLVRPRREVQVVQRARLALEQRSVNVNAAN